MFYSAVVVPTGTAVLGSAAAQGAITAHTVEALHLLGAAALGLLLWDLLTMAKPLRREQSLRWICWVIAAIAHGLLLYLYWLLISFMDAERRYVLIRPPFYPVHQLYLWTCTIQWLAMSILLFLTLREWRHQDHLGVSRTSHCGT